MLPLECAQTDHCLVAADPGPVCISEELYSQAVQGNTRSSDQQEAFCTSHAFYTGTLYTIISTYWFVW